jgi:hypothetical protein
MQVEDHNSSKKHDNTYAGKLRSNSSAERSVKEVQNLKIGVRSSDSARVMKFNKVLSETTVILGTLLCLCCSVLFTRNLFR